MVNILNIQQNQNKLDSCKKHEFIAEDIELIFGTKLECKHCGGLMNAIQAYAYARGYEAAGKNPNDIIAGFNFEGMKNAN